MIDSEKYRANVGIILLNQQNKVFWARRIKQWSWQFPQGGPKEGETVLAAMYRELREETGLLPNDVEVVAVSKNWLKYQLPKGLHKESEPLCIGQKQKWFLLRLLASDKTINLYATNKPEFDGWRWVDYWYPLSHVIPFKRHVYRKALESFHHLIQKPVIL